MVQLCIGHFPHFMSFFFPVNHLFFIKKNHYNIKQPHFQFVDVRVTYMKLKNASRPTLVCCTVLSALRFPFADPLFWASITCTNQVQNTIMQLSLEPIIWILIQCLIHPKPRKPRKPSKHYNITLLNSKHTGTRICTQLLSNCMYWYAIARHYLQVHQPSIITLHR